MNARTPEPGSLIPSAPFDDLDLEKPEDEIRAIHHVSIANLAKAIHSFDRVRIYDSTAR